jgi:hypothetical protein
MFHIVRPFERGVIQLSNPGAEVSSLGGLKNHFGLNFHIGKNAKQVQAKGLFKPLDLNLRQPIFL